MIDKIQYYRRLKNVSVSRLAKLIGVDANGREDVIIFFIFILKYDIIILVYKIGEIFVLYTFAKHRGDMLSHISLFLYGGDFYGKRR